MSTDKDPNEIKSLVSHETIQRKIYLIRGKRVMFDSDLAQLYEVRTKELNKSVKRNITRFPDDFMFQLSEEEVKILRFQIGTSRWGGRRFLPYAFTDYGILMLSSVLNSPRAILVNLQNMRTFTKLRELLNDHKDLRFRIEELEKKYDQQFQIIFKAIKVILDDKPKQDPPKRLDIN